MKMAEEQSGSTGSSNSEQKNDDSIIQRITNRIKGLNDTKFSDDIHDYFPKLIVALVSMISYLMTYQINATSSYIGSGLRVPSHNVGIFVAKLNSYRSFLMMVGFGFAYLIHYICNLLSKEQAAITLTIKIISLFFLYLLMGSRGCLLFSSFLTKNLSYNVYFFLSIDALAAGAFQMSLILLVPQFIFIIFLSIHLLAFVFFLTQFVFDLFLSHKALVMIRIQFFMCLIVSYIGFGLWAFYLFYYYDSEPKYYKEELYKQNDDMKKVNSIYLKLKELSKNLKEVFEKMGNIFTKWIYSCDDLINGLINIRSIILEIINSTNDFVKLLMKLLEYIKESKDKVEKLNENKLDSGSEKNKNNFSTQKSKHDDAEFKRKLEEINKIFTEFNNNNNDLSNLLGRLSNFPESLEVSLKKFNEYNGFENKKGIWEETISLISKYDKLFDYISKIGFNFQDSSKNSVSFNDLSSEMNKYESEVNNKISNIKKIFNENLKEFDDKINKIESDLKEITDIHDKIMKILYHNSDHIIFCYIMIALACFFRDFLYPPIIPHALLIENEAQKILLLGIILQLLFCFPVFILDEILNIFTLFIEEYFVYFWTLSVPPLIVLIFTLLAIHTKIAFFHLITGSTGRVFILILFLIPYYTLMESVSYSYLSHYVFYQLGFSHKNLLFILLHQLLEMFCTYFFSKLSAGYNHARVRLGHCLPTYTTNYELTFCQELWSMVKWTLQYTFKDILFFFSTNIRQYL